MLKLLITCLLFSLNAWATPEKIEVFFLSEQRAATLLELIDKKNLPNVYSSIAQNETAQEIPFDCVPMGEGCFHPQLGYIENRPQVLSPTPKDPVPEGMSPQTFQSLDVDLVECREGHYFDIFCGQAKGQPEQKRADLEIWFDISTSMRKTDYSKDLDRCFRRTFAEVLDKRCEKRPTFAVFNTSIKTIQDLSQICLLQGTNNTERIVEWVKASKARHLIIVTDTEEYTGAFRDLLAVENSVLHGLDTVNLTSDHLTKYSDKLLNSCKK